MSVKPVQFVSVVEFSVQNSYTLRNLLQVKADEFDYNYEYKKSQQKCKAILKYKIACIPLRLFQHLNIDAVVFFNEKESTSSTRARLTPQNTMDQH